MKSAAVFLSSIVLVSQLISPLQCMSLGNADAPDQADGCRETMVLYNLTFKTFWSEDRFEKQYPRYRPPAQWSRLEGNENEQPHEQSKLHKNFFISHKVASMTSRSSSFARVSSAVTHCANSASEE